MSRCSAFVVFRRSIALRPALCVPPDLAVRGNRWQVLRNFAPRIRSKSDLRRPTTKRVLSAGPSHKQRHCRNIHPVEAAAPASPAPAQAGRFPAPACQKLAGAGSSWQVPGSQWQPMAVPWQTIRKAPPFPSLPRPRRAGVRRQTPPARCDVVTLEASVEVIVAAAGVHPVASPAVSILRFSREVTRTGVRCGHLFNPSLLRKTDGLKGST